MAHKYTTFNSAFTAWKNVWDDAYTRWWDTSTYNSNALQHWFLGQTLPAIEDLCNAVGSLQQCVRYIMGSVTVNPEQAELPECFYWLKQESAAEPLTMDGILSVMLTATFSQLQKFIGIEDAYRVSLWNAPFNADFYAALARGFQQWP